MSLAQLPLRSEPLVDEEKFPTLPWQAFFEGLSSGDTGVVWLPTFTNLTSVGTPTITGVYYRLSARLVVFYITITPATSTTAVAGTTYCTGFPLTFSKQGVSLSISGSSAIAAGLDIDGKIYTSSWTAITTPITILGIGEVR